MNELGLYICHVTLVEVYYNLAVTFCHIALLVYSIVDLHTLVDCHFVPDLLVTVVFFYLCVWLHAPCSLLSYMSMPSCVCVCLCVFVRA